MQSHNPHQGSSTGGGRRLSISSSNVVTPHVSQPPSTVAFPRFDSSVSSSDMIHHPHHGSGGYGHNRYPSTVSLAATTRSSVNRANALELHDLIYGGGSALNVDNPENARQVLEKLYEQDAVYSNPLMTASSNEVIKDIHSFLHQFTAVSIPRPLSLMKRLFGSKQDTEYLSIAKLWSEVEEVLESDVFDGHRRVVIEHKVYLLFLPEFFAPNLPARDSVMLHSSASQLSLADSSLAPTPSGTPGPGGGLPYIAGGAPSTSHRPSLGNVARMVTTLARQVTLPVHTRLSFNDSGRIVHHQDIWDIKDVVNLVPGMSAVQWVGSRLLAHGLAMGFDLYTLASGAGSKRGASGGRASDRYGIVKKEEEGEDETPRGGTERSLEMTSSSGRPGSRTTFHLGSEWGSTRSSVSGFNALGLHLPPSRNRAPDNDSDA